jgi:magnesium transporter
MLRNLEPLMAPLDELAHGTDLDGHDEELDEYFRDVADHLRRLVGRLDTINSVLSDVLQAHLAQVSMTQNDDMRRMSAWAAIFLVPTLMAGIWGMNFDGMPELDWRFGYPVALGSMLLASTTLWWQFRRIGWLVARARGRSPG